MFEAVLFLYIFWTCCGHNYKSFSFPGPVGAWEGIPEPIPNGGVPGGGGGGGAGGANLHT